MEPINDKAARDGQEQHRLVAVDGDRNHPAISPLAGRSGSASPAAAEPSVLPSVMARAGAHRARAAATVRASSRPLLKLGIATKGVFKIAFASPRKVSVSLWEAARGVEFMSRGINHGDV